MVWWKCLLSSDWLLVWLICKCKYWGFQRSLTVRSPLWWSGSSWSLGPGCSDTPWWSDSTFPGSIPPRTPWCSTDSAPSAPSAAPDSSPPFCVRVYKCMCVCDHCAATLPWGVYIPHWPLLKTRGERHRSAESAHTHSKPALTHNRHTILWASGTQWHSLNQHNL